jgi:hypothetical protein
VATPDLGHWSWKDEQEYAQGRRIGLITDTDHARVSLARERAVALLESHSGPFADPAAALTDPSGWPRPALPPEALTTAIHA